LPSESTDPKDAQGSKGGGELHHDSETARTKKLCGALLRLEFLRRTISAYLISEIVSRCGTLLAVPATLMLFRYLMDPNPTLFPWSPAVDRAVAYTSLTNVTSAEDAALLADFVANRYLGAPAQPIDNATIGIRTAILLISEVIFSTLLYLIGFFVGADMDRIHLGQSFALLSWARPVLSAVLFACSVFSVMSTYKLDWLVC
jgi:hypothetical protein